MLDDYSKDIASTPEMAMRIARSLEKTASQITGFREAHANTMARAAEFRQRAADIATGVIPTRNGIAADGWNSRRR